MRNNATKGNILQYFFYNIKNVRKGHLSSAAHSFISHFHFSFIFFHLSFVLLITSCARMGNPDGGWFDDTPPRVIGASPAEKSTNVNSRKINIYFDEYIKLQDAQNKVIVSPPQLEQAEIKDGGRRIQIELKDSLKANTTYTIDFGDAIVDNNEGNPMGNYAYSFSTYDEIDTLEVAGYVLNAENLEPIKGILVGLYENLSDTIFRKEPMIRISRTDSRGHFSIKGAAARTYRAYALQDADADFVYNQKSEMIAFSHDTFVPSWKPDTRQDTIWRDTLHIENIISVPYTHFLPDDITLLAFTAVQSDRYLLKTERTQPERLDFYFSYGSEELPAIKGLNFESDSAFVLEANSRQDTLKYWLRDTALVNQDTLRMEVQYLMSDSTGTLVSKTDTLEMLPKISYEKRMKEKQKELEKWEKEQQKKKKRGEPYDSIPPRVPLKVKFTASGAIAPNQRIWLETPEPLERLDTAAFHIQMKVDSLWNDVACEVRPSETNIRQYEIVAQWEPEQEYVIDIDSAAMCTVYGVTSDKIKQTVKVKSLEEFGTLAVTVSGVAADTTIIVQLLSSQDSPVKSQRADKNGYVKFEYVNPGKYYLRAFIDSNGNGIWDTGDYDSDRQAEAVYYYHEETECKAKWDMKRQWNLTAKPRFQQKPGAITKQKADQQRKQQNRNLQRAKQMGLDYLQNKTGMRL